MAVVAEVEQARWSRPQRAVVAVAVLAGLAARWWALGSRSLTFDEAFTAAYARMPIGDLPSALRGDDAHPPLDYLIRHVVAGSGSEWLLRAPSAVFATIGLALMVAWMRRRGWFGVTAVVLFALSPFQLLYGREARMYALAALLGLAVAVLSERWLRGDRRPAVLVGTGVLIAAACLDHVSGLLLAAGVLAVPGVRRDRDAWWWRLVPVSGVVVWAVAWAPSFVVQVGATSSSWVPFTTPTSVATAAGGLTTFIEGAGWVASAAIVAGALCTWALDRVMGRLMAALLAVPVALLALAGLQHHVVLSRTLAPASWAAPVALAALLTWCWARRPLLAVAAAIVVGTLVVRSLPRSVTYDEGTASAVAGGMARVEPGDGLFVHPNWWWPLATWNGAELDVAGQEPPPSLADDDGWYWLRPGAAATGTTWVLHPDAYPFDTGRWSSCGSTEALGDGWLLDCVVTGGS